MNARRVIFDTEGQAIQITDRVALCPDDLDEILARHGEYDLHIQARPEKIQGRSTGAWIIDYNFVKTNENKI